MAATIASGRGCPPGPSLGRWLKRTAMAGAVAALLALGGRPALAADDTITVTDLAGRTVTVKKGVEHAVLGEGRLFYGTVVLDKEHPFDHIAAMADDLKKYDPDTWDQYLARFPEAKDVQLLGALINTDFSIEKVITLDADLVIASLGSYQKAMATGVVDKLDKAGIPTIFIDFRENPIQNTVPSMLLLGRVFDREAEAQAYVDFYTQGMQRVYTRLVGLKESERPVVFVERAAGLDPSACCQTFGPTNFGQFVAEAGGVNWGSRYFGGLGGLVNPEKMLLDDPAFWLLTGANWSESYPGNSAVWLGYEAEPAKAEAQLQNLASRRGFAEMQAVKSKKVMAIYHQFYQSPYHVVAIEALARWMHPDLFADLDPWGEFEKLHERFLPIKLTGTFWITLK